MNARFRVSAAVFLAALPLFSYPNRVPAGHAGVPGETNPPCAPCHTVSLNPAGGGVSVELAGGPVYTPGQSQRVTVRISDPDTARRYGFQLAARTASNAQAGTFTAGVGTALTVQAPFVYVNQTNSAASYTFEWTPPSGAETLRLYVAGLASRGVRDSRVYTAVQEVRPAAAAGPALRAANPVVNGASYLPLVGPGAWLTIFGENLAPAARAWNAADIVDGVLPRSLDGVSVTVNGRPAAVYYISPTQLNVQAPDDEHAGTVEVKVTTPGGSTAAFAPLGRFAPGLFAFAPESNRYAAARAPSFRAYPPARTSSSRSSARHPAPLPLRK